MILLHCYHISELRSRSPPRYDVGSQHLCVRSHNTYEGMMASRKSLSRPVAEGRKRKDREKLYFLALVTTFLLYCYRETLPKKFKKSLRAGRGEAAVQNGEKKRAK